MATIQEVATVLKNLSAAYGQAVTADQAKAYHAVLRDYDRLYLARAAGLLAASSKFMPRPAEMVDAVKKETLSGRWFPPREPEDATLMWACYARGIGPDELSEAEIEAARKAGGQAAPRGDRQAAITASLRKYGVDA
jgi:hypothetical protein